MRFSAIVTTNGIPHNIILSEARGTWGHVWILTSFNAVSETEEPTSADEFNVPEDIPTYLMPDIYPPKYPSYTCAMCKMEFEGRPACYTSKGLPLCWHYDCGGEYADDD